MPGEAVLVWEHLFEVEVEEEVENHKAKIEEYVEIGLFAVELDVVQICGVGDLRDPVEVLDEVLAAVGQAQRSKKQLPKIP